MQLSNSMLYFRIFLLQVFYLLQELICESLDQFEHAFKMLGGSLSTFEENSFVFVCITVSKNPRHHQ